MSDYHRSFYEIPYWCGMRGSCHFDGMGGCWGISHGLVHKHGRSYCYQCTFYKRTLERTAGKEMAWMPDTPTYRVPLARQRSDGWETRI